MGSHRSYTPSEKHTVCVNKRKAAEGNARDERLPAPEESESIPDLVGVSVLPTRVGDSR